MTLTANECYVILVKDLATYLSQWYPLVAIDPCKEQYPYKGSKIDLYTRNANYLFYSIIWHNGMQIQSFLDQLAQRVGNNESIIEVGCETAFTGLTLAMIREKPITIHDYEGLGPRFALWFAEKQGLDITFEPYGNMPRGYDWVVATDVLEHSGNHLLFLVWLNNMAKHFAISYPIIVDSYPPYMEQLDEWVDDNAICHIIAGRYDVEVAHIPDDGRRYLVYHEKSKE